MALSLGFGANKSSSKTTATENFSKTGTQTQTLDPRLEQALYGNLERATTLAGAGANDNLQTYWQTLMNLAGNNPGEQAMNNAVAGAQAAMNYTPQQVQAGTLNASTYNPTLGSAVNANAVTAQTALVDPSQIATAGGVDRGSIRDVNLGAFDGSQIRALMNPYEQDVVNAFQTDAERARQVARSADSADAARAGAWGGARHGVADARTNEANIRALDAATANLRHQGWATAGGLALGARGQDLAGQQSNQGADLSVAGMNNQTGMFNAGQQNQGLFFNANAQNDTNRFNAGQLNDTSRFNAGQTNQMTGLNMNALNSAGQFNAGQTQSAAQAQMMANLQAALANQGAGLQGAQLGLQGASLLGNLGGQQLQQAIDLANLQGQAGSQQADLSIQLQQLINQSLGLIPSYGTTIDNQSGTSTTNSSTRGSNVGVTAGFSYGGKG